VGGPWGSAKTKNCEKPSVKTTAQEVDRGEEMTGVRKKCFETRKEGKKTPVGGCKKGSSGEGVSSTSHEV